MITAVDTSVLLDIFLPDDQHGEESKRRLREAYDSGAIIACDVVHAELAAMFRDRTQLDGAYGDDHAYLRNEAKSPIPKKLRRFRHGIGACP